MSGGGNVKVGAATVRLDLDVPAVVNYNFQTIERGWSGLSFTPKAFY
jgi:hypothetical protein